MVSYDGKTFPAYSTLVTTQSYYYTLTYRQTTHLYIELKNKKTLVGYVCKMWIVILANY